MSFDCKDFLRETVDFAQDKNIEKPTIELIYYRLLTQQTIQDDITEHHGIHAYTLADAFEDQLSDKTFIGNGRAGMSNNDKEKQLKPELDQKYKNEIIMYQSQCLGFDREQTAYGLFVHLMTSDNLEIPAVLAPISKKLKEEVENCVWETFKNSAEDTANVIEPVYRFVVKGKAEPS